MDGLDEQAADTARIDVQCLSCGRVSSFPGNDQRVFGTPLVELTKRLRCSQCGSRAVKATTVRTPRDIARRLRAAMRSGKA